MMSSRQTNPASICGHNHEDGGSVRSWWSWRSQSPDCFYWKWFWMRNERVNMQEARLLSYILYSHPGFSSILKSVIPFPVYVQCYLQEALNISILLISAAAAAAWGVSVLHSVSVAICNTKYGLSAWISAVAHPTDSMIAMTAHSCSSVPARTLVRHFLPPDTTSNPDPEPCRSERRASACAVTLTHLSSAYFFLHYSPKLSFKGWRNDASQSKMKLILQPQQQKSDADSDEQSLTSETINYKYLHI